VSVNRRDLLKLGLVLGSTASANAAGSQGSRPPGSAAAGEYASGAGEHASVGGEHRVPGPRPAESYDAEFIVVGSGAGGGTVAARLAEAGFTVLLLEAGGDPRTLSGGNPHTPDANTLPDDYDVPAFHALATEHEALRWDFFVRHYADNEQQRRDPKYRETWNGEPVDGVFYPRAGTLGGCTAHNAMIFVYPHDEDWNAIADITSDRSWRAESMRGYFERLEHCSHRRWERFRSRFGINPSRHGWSGWLHTEFAVPDAVFRNRDMRTALIESARGILQQVGRPAGDRARLESQADPNDWRVVRDSAPGLRYTPLTTRNHVRVGSRERLLDVQQRHPGRLRIEMHALATRVLFDGTRAVGVEYRKGERLYRAHAQPSTGPGELREARASREVILAGGAFNTPQLLMLSGIGGSDALAPHGIAQRVDLPGVGRNLQDRYEVAVVNRMAFDAWEALEGATFTRADRQYAEWSKRRAGVYATNGALLSVTLPSGPGHPVPDLFCYALLGKFPGYLPGYSKAAAEQHNYLTWVVLKGHTDNVGGRVTLRSADPRDRPDVNFHYFDEGRPTGDDDVDAVVAGIDFVRKATEGLKRQGLVAEEELPGDARRSPAELRQFVRDHAWGHHASCTCPIGARDRGGVLTSDFRVHGTEGLRVVDASVFPRVPGLFIASAVYMIGEKAADVIATTARR
jgi:choline dehydrogenase-like flavoprotein